MQNITGNCYAIAGALVIVLIIAGVAPVAFKNQVSDGVEYIGYPGFGYYLALALMLILLLPQVRAEVVNKLGLKYLVIQSIIFVPFIAWGTHMLIFLFQATDL